MKEKVLVMGASLNPARYSFMAINMLLDYGHNVYAFGLKEGEVQSVWINDKLKPIEELDTITLYLGPQNQVEYYDYILNSGAKRVIFNPGTENPEFHAKLEANGIHAEVACTLVLLRTEQFAA